jgi:hypothetical protein
MYNHDHEIAKIVDEACKAFAEGKHISENPYTKSYWIYNDEPIGPIWNDAFLKAKAKAEDNTGKILGKIDLNKVRK